MKQYTQYIHKDDEWRILGGVQSDNADWNQNDDTKSDYIKNRTHYIEDSETCIEETFNSCTFSNQGNYYKAELSLDYFMPEEGDIITITVNNHTFTDKLQRVIPPDGPEDYQWGGNGIYEMGDPALVYDFGTYDNIQKPYYLWFNNYYGSTYWELDLGSDILSSSGSYEVEFSLVRNSYKALEPEYSPYNVKENNIILNDLRNVVGSHHALAEGIGTAATGVGAHAEGFGYGTFPEEETIYSLDNIEIIRGDSTNNTIVIYDSSEDFYDLKKGYLLYAEEKDTLAKGGGTKAAAASPDFLGEIEKIEDYYDDEYQPALICYLKNVPEDIDLSDYEPSGSTIYKLEVHSCKYTSATWAAGGASHAEGVNTQSLGDAAHAEGFHTYAYGFASHAEGYSTGASGQGSHAEGNYTSTSGSSSHAEGSHAEATGNTSHAEGYYTEAKGSYQHVQGKYNIIDNNNTYADIVGNGTGINARSNAYTLDWSGNGTFAGKVTVGTAPTNDLDVATKKYVDDSLVDRLPTFYISSNSASDPFVVKANEIGHYVFKPTVNSIYIKMETSGSTNRVINFNELIVFDNNPANGAEFAYCWYPASGGIARVMLIANSSLDGGIGWSGSTSGFGNYALKTYVDDAIAALPEPMIFKGSLGTGGTITSLPTASSENEGFTYKVITAGTYASQTAKIGDTFISDGTTWILIPSGDEPSGTVTSVKIQATSPIAIDNDAAITTSGTRTLSHADSGVSAGTYKSVTVDAKGHVTGGSNPTTLSGYGITDANINNGTITLGNNTITPFIGGVSGEGSSQETIANFIDLSTSQSIEDGIAIGSNAKNSNNENFEGIIYLNSNVNSASTSMQVSKAGNSLEGVGKIKLSYDDSSVGTSKINIELNSHAIDMLARDELNLNGGNGEINISATGGVNIHNIVTPTNNTDAVNKQYVDNAISSVTPTLPNASSTVVGGIKVRYDADTYTLYMTNDGTDA